VPVGSVDYDEGAATMQADVNNDEVPETVQAGVLETLLGQPRIYYNDSVVDSLAMIGRE